jgi:hypothetical protein
MGNRIGDVPLWKGVTLSPLQDTNGFSIKKR